MAVKTLLAALTLGALAGGPPAATSAGTFSCGQCFEAFDGRGHNFTYGPGACGPSGKLCMDCMAFNACHLNTQQGSCSEWHYFCAGSAVETALLGAEVEAALAAADPGKLQSLLGGARDRVTLNPGRMAVQVTGCVGVVVASYPLPAPLLAALEAAPARVAD